MTTNRSPLRLVCAALALWPLSLQVRAGEVTASLEDGALVVRDGDDLFSRYHHDDTFTPFLYPLHGPGGIAVTRGFPMEELPGESGDHPHHRSLWFAHGAVNGHDFWHPAQTSIRHTGFELIGGDGAGSAVVTSRNEWRTKQGELICVERRTMRFGSTEAGRTIDFDIELGSDEHELVFGDTKEGTFAIRLAPGLRIEGALATGRSINSAGDEDGACWGKRAGWVAYRGEVSDRACTVAIFDHPENVSHPTWWHARTYGLFAANPFGVHDFERRPPGTGDRRVARGERMTFRYRVFLAAGEAEPPELTRAYERYLASPPVPRSPLAAAGEVELVRDGFLFTEGPAWSSGRSSLLFSDIPANRIYELDAAGEISVFREPSHYANGLLVDELGRLWACEHGGRRVSRGALDDADPKALAYEFGGARLNSPNDLALRGDGHLYFTDPPYGLLGKPSELGANHVFHRTPKGELEVVFRGGESSRPNGIRLSPRGDRLYVAFTDEGVVRRFPVAPDGTTGESEEFAKTSPGPDGMAVDRDGNLYVTAKAGVEVFSPGGERWGVIEVPQKPANCAFGGSDGRTLFITARKGLYRVRLGIPGLLH
ncbi:MAG: PmoA family protein [Planctomycetota bacterium]|jgi:gluconolactonase|nr:PmoA family protein [Planctomycetota bacterium]MDP6763819.1 PmoA family protein [Planctomycetota bacterium]MDP6989685.1 PmoA family protein [Planctomycetota bacterium]